MLDDERYVGALSVEEAQTLTLAFLNSRGEVGASEDDIVAMLNVFNVWAIGRTLLSMALKGLLNFELTQDRDDLNFWLTPDMKEQLAEIHNEELLALLDGRLELKGNEIEEIENPSE